MLCVDAKHVSFFMCSGRHTSLKRVFPFAGTGIMRAAL